MLFKNFDPQKKKRLTILDEKGKITNPELEPKIDKDTLLKMYKTMTLARVVDIKSLQYQRQGRLLTYAPNIGQEAAQIGATATLEQKDWFSPGFRELNAFLYRGVKLKEVFLYWFGNEWGNHFDESVRVLPVNVIIGSQVSHATGLALASKIQDKKEVVLTMIGDGGTSHGEFSEGLNYAATFNAPVVCVIQNNQYAISTPRSKATKAETLAQKAVGFGIPGIQVDGNDVLAMYVATKEAVDYARAGNGPVLIEAVTYRIGPHTTSDDPTIYRSNEEVEEWKKKDPIIRFKQYLIDKKYWTEKQDKELDEENNKHVGEVFRDVEKNGHTELLDIFKYTYQDMTPQIKEQYENYRKFLEEGGK